MTLQQALSHARKVLADGNVEDASLESELLLRHVLHLNRVQLYLDPDRSLNSEEQSSLWKLVERRLSGEPTAYIVGHREFYGLDFHVDPNVLIPRPESELLVEKALAIANRRPVTSIAEIGTGSGAIAISLALNLPDTGIYATDISASALEVARFNCRKHGVLDRIHLLQGDMLDPLSEPADLIIANLPYVQEKDVYRTNFEPRLALDGGTDGLEKIRRLCLQVGDRLRPDGCLLMEIGQGQRNAVTGLLRVLFPSAEIETAADLSDTERVVSLRLTTSTVTR